MLVVVELDLLRVDQHQAHFVRRGRIRIEESIALTQALLPEPVVPATSTCGIFAMSVQTALPSIPLPSQATSGEVFCGRPA